MKISQMSLLASAMNPLQFPGSTNLNFANFAPFKEGVSYTKRIPNCQKCGQHNRKSRLKGHKRVCPFKDCNCPKCQVVTERQKLMADQIKIRRRQRKDTLMNLTREKITATLNAAAAMAAAGPLPYLNNLSLIYNLSQTTTSPTTEPNPVTATTAGLPTTFASTATTSPTLPSANAFLPLGASAPVNGYMTPDLLKAAAAITSSADPICTSPLQLSQFPLFLGATPSANSTTGTAASPPALPVAATTDLKTESLPTSPARSPKTNGSPSPSATTESFIAAPIPINPLSSLPNSFMPSTSSAGMSVQEQLLAFLANVQLSSCFPGVNATPSEPESASTGVEAASPKATNSAPSTAFVDICTV